MFVRRRLLVAFLFALGVGKFVKSLNVLSWEEACELNPKLKSKVAAQ